MPASAGSVLCHRVWLLAASLAFLTACWIPTTPGALPEGATGAWPMPRGDGRLTGHAELIGAIAKPQLLGRLDLGASRCTRATLADLNGDGIQEILAEDAAGLLAVSNDGALLWHADTYKTPVVTVTDLDGDGGAEVVLRGPEVRGGIDGRVLWQAAGAFARHEWRILAGCFLAGARGQQLVAVTMHGYDLVAHLYTFEDGIQGGRALWERTFQTSDFGDFGGMMVADVDSDGEVELCAAVQAGLVALDLRTGVEELRYEWPVGDGRRVRNYGQLSARDVDADGRMEVVLVNSLVTLQLAVVRLQGPGAPGLAWNRYWGDWYPASAHLLHGAAGSIADLDGDGRLEIALSLYEHGKGWSLQVLDAATGQVHAERPGLYLDAVVPRAGQPSVLVCSEQRGPLPARFTAVRGLTCSVEGLREAWCHADARLEGQWADRREEGAAPLSSATLDLREPVLADWSGDGQPELLLSLDRDRDGRTDGLAAGQTDDTGWAESATWSVDPDDDLAVLGVAPDRADGEHRLLVANASGHVWALDRRGVQSARFFAGGAFVPGAAVADLDGDGRNEIVATGSDGLVRAVRFTGHRGTPFRVLWQRPGWGTAGQLGSAESPLLADLDGDNRHEVLVGVFERARGAGLECLDGSGARRWVWFWPAEVPGPEQRAVKRWTVGRFRSAETLDVFLSTRAGDQTGGDMAQECWLLDGRTGTVIWHRTAADMTDFYWYPTLGPGDLASVWDGDGDGAEDAVMMSHSLIVTLSGVDGRPLRRPLSPSQAFGEGTPWTADGSVVIQDADRDRQVDLILSGTVGAWGVLTGQGQPVWSVDPGIESSCRLHGGIGDVDGDGRLELGMPHGTGFRCYDVATGTLRWQIEGLIGTTEVVTGDVDGDRRDDFVLGVGQRVVTISGDNLGGHERWSVDLGAVAGAPLLADVDGDRKVEVVVGVADGSLVVIGGKR